MAKSFGDLPMFTKADADRSPFPIDRLFRRMCIAKGISQPHFRNMFVKSSEEMGIPRNVINQNHNNARKAMWAPNGLSFNMFHRFINMIFGGHLLDVTITFKGPDGTVEVFSSDAVSASVQIRNDAGDIETFSGKNESD